MGERPGVIRWVENSEIRLFHDPQEGIIEAEADVFITGGRIDLDRFPGLQQLRRDHGITRATNHTRHQCKVEFPGGE